MIRRGDIISHLDMCREEGVSLQRGMNFRMRDGISVILMSLRSNAPYADHVEDDGRFCIMKAMTYLEERWPGSEVSGPTWA